MRSLQAICLLCCLAFSLTAFGQVPNISSFSPLFGPIGTTVTVQGQHFNPISSNNIVYFGGVKGTVKTASQTILTVTVPIGAANKPITVLNIVNGLMASSTRPFSVTFNDPAKNSFSASSFSHSTIDLSNNNAGGFSELADLDGDGKLDMGAAVRFNQELVIYRNVGKIGSISNSSFTKVATYYVSPSYLAHSPQQLRFADLDGDGKLDMVVPYLDQNFVAVYKNTSSPGLISFAPEVKFSVGGGGIVEIADLDNDGKPEILTAYGYLINKTSKGIINSSSFTMVNHASLENELIRSVQAEDLDEDGKMDILISNGYGFKTFRNTSSSTGNFSFQEKTFSPSGNNGYSKALAGDFDNDGKKDVVMFKPRGKNLTVSKNTTSGGSDFSFASAIPLPTAWGLTDVAVCDINGDTKLDIITAPYGYGYSVFRNRSSASMEFGEELTLETSSVVNEGNITSGDIDGDGKPDIVGYATYETHFFLNNIIGAPEIVSFSPTTAKTGEKITITGKNFTAVSTVDIGNLKATNVTVVSSNTITALVAAKAGNGAVIVTTADGSISLEGFIYNPPPRPVITAITPDSGSVDQTVVISGSGFAEITGVYFGGVKAKSYVVNSPTTITAVLGAGTIGDVTIETPEWTSRFSGFSYLPRPTISHPFWSGAKGETIRITGTNLSTTTKITLGGVEPASFKVISSELIEAVVGDGETGQVVVTTAYGTTSSGGNDFIFISNPPKVTSFSPMSANVGASVRIMGENFSLIPENNWVYFGAARAKVRSCTTTELIVTVPTGSTYGLVSVWVNARIGYSSLPFASTGNGKQNLGAASFGKKVTHFAGRAASQMIAGDFEPDGKTDIAVAATASTGNPVIARNRSTIEDIGFTRYDPITNTRGEDRTPVSLTAVNNGRLGLITLNSGGSASIALLTNFKTTELNEGYYFTSSARDGSFGYLNNIVVGNLLDNGGNDRLSAGPDFYNIVLCDVDGDGKQDVIERKYGEQYYNVQKVVAVHLNISYKNDQGYHMLKFAPPVNLKVDGFPRDVATGDFDGDGKLDLAVTCFDSGGKDDFVQIFNNKSTLGNPSFDAGTKIGSIADIEKIVVSDVDGDGKVDLLVGNNHKLSIYTNSTHNAISFNKKTDIDLPASKGIIVCDFNGDGFPDLAGLEADTITVLRNLSTEPTIASFSPVVGTKDSTISIIGANLTGVTAVMIGGVPAKSFTVVSATKLNVEIGGGASGPIEVSTANGNCKLQGFTYIDLPVISAGAPTSFVIGNHVTLSVTGNVNFTYQWFRDGTLLKGASSNTFNATGKGNYTVTVTMASERFTSAALKISTTAPMITADGPTTFDAGGGVVLSVPAVGGLSYQWLRDGVAVPGAASNAISAHASGSYSLSVKSQEEELKTESIKVTAVVPIITANGPTAFNSGNNVTLSVPAGTDLVYQWSRDGSVISGAVSNTLVAGTTGSYSVTISVGSEKFDLSPVKILSLSPGNFKLAAISSPCRNVAKGSIDISVNETHNYNFILIDPEGSRTTGSFFNTHQIKNLKAGTYNICIGMEDYPGYKQCFSLEVTQPKDLAVYALVNEKENKVLLTLSGAQTFFISLNGRTYKTGENAISLPLQMGSNTIKVSSATACQGVIEKNILMENGIKVYPNPVSDILYLDITENGAKYAIIELVGISGTPTFRAQYPIDGNAVKIDVSNFATGLYIVKIKLDTGKTKNYKILKK